MEDLFIGCLTVILVVILLGIIYCAFGALFMWGWNLVLPLFGVFEITYLQSLGAVLLLAIIGKLMFSKTTTFNINK